MPSDPSAGQPARRCAILAGGLGSRVGGPKATMPLAGRTLIDHVLAAALGAELEPLVVAKADTPLEGVAVSVLREPPSPRHPLVGVIAALESVGEPLVVVPCDVPLLPAGLLAALAARPEPLVVCRAGERLQPLVGRYTPGLLDGLRAGLDADASMTATVEALGPAVIGDEELLGLGVGPGSFLNINDPADLIRAEQLFARPRSARSAQPPR